MTEFIPIEMTIDHEAQTATLSGECPPIETLLTGIGYDVTQIEYDRD